MSAEMEALQQQINRFSGDLTYAFVPIACDGATGPNTMNALLLALRKIQDDLNVPLPSTAINWFSPVEVAKFQQQIEAGRATNSLAALAADTVNQLTKPSAIPPRASGLTQLLKASADKLRLGAVVCPDARPSGGGYAPPSSGGYAPGAALTPAGQQYQQQNRRRTQEGILGLGLPDWVVYVGGGALAVGLGYLVLGKLRSGPAAPAPGPARLIRRAPAPTVVDQRTVIPE